MILPFFFFEMHLKITSIYSGHQIFHMTLEHSLKKDSYSFKPKTLICTVVLPLSNKFYFHVPKNNIKFNFSFFSRNKSERNPPCDFLPFLILKKLITSRNI